MLTRINGAYRSICISVFLMAMTAIAALADGTTQTYDPGQFGGPTAQTWFDAAQGFGKGIAPMVTTLLPVMVVLLAIFKGPAILKRIVNKGTN